MNLPNLISLGRLFCAPLMVWLIISMQYTSAFWLFCIAGLSDLVDGLLARILKDTTVIGKYLDPIADKALLVSVIISLGIQGSLPSWFVIIAVFRDVLILGGILIYMVIDHPIKIDPLLTSKINTVLQIVCAATILLEKMLGHSYVTLNHTLFIITTVATVLSGLLYVRQGIRGLTHAPHE